jgi:hypothetical protein
MRGGKGGNADASHLSIQVTCVRDNLATALLLVEAGVQIEIIVCGVRSVDFNRT